MARHLLCKITFFVLPEKKQQQHKKKRTAIKEIYRRDAVLAGLDVVRYQGGGGG